MGGKQLVGVTRMRALAAGLWAAVFLVVFPGGTLGAKETTITVHAGKADSPNYALAKQFAEALALSGNGAFTLVVEESQGSVQNVMDAPTQDENYIFTASAGVIAQAQRGDKPFDPNPHYDEIRALFPIPAQTIHWIVLRDSGIKTLAELAGHSLVAGNKGSLGERVTEETLQALGIDQAVQLIDTDLAGAPGGLQANQVNGLALTGSYPLPAVTALARATPIRILSLPQALIAKIRAIDDSTAGIVIPKGTYPGVDYEVVTLAMPAGAYTTLNMSTATAYALTKAFWSQRFALAKKNPAWAEIVPSYLASLGVKLHRGALRYYTEAGIKVPAALY
jgi:TRAP transporter TAXI family solute receptor